jgi:hypothetical protein
MLWSCGCSYMRLEWALRRLEGPLALVPYSPQHR